MVRKALARKEKRVAEWDDKLKAIKSREAASVYVGEIGERREFHLTVDRVHHFDGQWGLTYFNICRDQDDNIVVYRGSNGWWKGDKLVVMATIKDHSEFRGARQTIINRPKVHDVDDSGRK